MEKNASFTSIQLSLKKNEHFQVFKSDGKNDLETRKARKWTASFGSLDRCLRPALDEYQSRCNWNLFVFSMLAKWLTYGKQLWPKDPLWQATHEMQREISAVNF